MSKRNASEITCQEGSPKKKRKITHYKFRAECVNDVCEFIKNGNVEWTRMEIHRDPDGLPDVDVDIESPAALVDLQQGMGRVTDGHVMKETVNEAANYSGIRKPEGHRDLFKDFPFIAARRAEAKGDDIKEFFLPFIRYVEKYCQQGPEAELFTHVVLVLMCRRIKGMTDAELLKAMTFHVNQTEDFFCTMSWRKTLPKEIADACNVIEQSHNCTSERAKNIVSLMEWVTVQLCEWEGNDEELRDEHERAVVTVLERFCKAN